MEKRLKRAEKLLVLKKKMEDELASNENKKNENEVSFLNGFIIKIYRFLLMNWINFRVHLKQSSLALIVSI